MLPCLACNKAKHRETADDSCLGLLYSPLPIDMFRLDAFDLKPEVGKLSEIHKQASENPDRLEQKASPPPASLPESIW